MDFENPVALIAVGVERAHFARIIRVDVQSYLVIRDALMGKLTDQMAGDWAAEFPAVFLGQGDGVGEEFVRSDLRMSAEIFFAFGEGRGDIVAQSQFHRIVANDKSAAEVRFPFFEDRAEIEK